jgi:hypothetical protein
LKGSDHLEFLLDHRLYRPLSTEPLEDLYEKVAPHAPDFTFVTAREVEEGTAPKETLILPPGHHNQIAKILSVPELSSEVERAVWQVDNALRKQAAQKDPNSVQMSNEVDEQAKK